MSQAFSFHKPLLIIDKVGLVGTELINELPKKQVVVFITNKKFSPEKNIVFLPFGHRTPRIPDNTFCGIITVDFTEDDMEDFAKTLVEKAKVSKCNLFFVENVYKLSLRFLKIYRRVSSSSSLILYADIISINIPFQNRAEFLIQSAVKNKEIHLPHSGIDFLYPVMANDGAKWIFNMLFSKQSPSTYCLFSSNGITELTLARYLHAKLPDLTIHLQENNKKQTELLLPSNSTFLPPSDYSINEELKKITLSQFNQIDIRLPIVTTIKDTVHRSNTKLFIFATCLLIVFLIIITPMFFAIIGRSSLLAGIHALETGNTKVAYAFVKTSSDTFTLAEDTQKPLLYICSLVGLSDVSTHFANDIAIGKQLSIATNYFVTAATFLHDASPTNQDAIEAIANAKFAFIVINQLQAEHDLSILPVQTQNYINELAKYFSAFSPVLPDLLGFSQQRHYLVLFLNNNELRPGGGFIGSYMDLFVQNGTISQSLIHDVYDADGQLKGHVEPPEPLNRYLGLSNWFLRDSNFSLDQQENARLESYFYNLEINKTVDGVIALDTSVMTKLLRITGPIVVPEYKQTVTADNFFILTEDHAEKHFFPGSIQKQTFLASFASALLNHVRSRPIALNSLINFFVSSVNEKHITFFINNNQVQGALNQTFFGVDFQDLYRIPRDLFDFFGENETNVGANKVNYYIQRKFDHIITIDAGGNINHTVNITLTNTSNQSSPYGGDYKTFLRFIIPKNSVITALTINGQTQALIPPEQSTNPIYKGKQILQQNGLTLFNEDVAGKNAYGFYVVVPKSSAVTINIAYMLQQTISDSQKRFYQLSLYKQPGTNNDPATLEFNVSTPFHIYSINNQNVGNITSASEQKGLLTDQLFSASIGK